MGGAERYIRFDPWPIYTPSRRPELRALVMLAALDLDELLHERPPAAAARNGPGTIDRPWDRRALLFPTS